MASNRHAASDHTCPRGPPRHVRRGRPPSKPPEGDGHTVARGPVASLRRGPVRIDGMAKRGKTSAVLSLLGVSNNVHAISGSTAPGLTFAPQKLSIQVTIVITTACSGIYSFGIFASAFVAFVLTEYERSSPWMWALLGLGFLAS